MVTVATSDNHPPFLALVAHTPTGTRVVARTVVRCIDGASTTEDNRITTAVKFIRSSDERGGIGGRIWRRRNIKGNEEEVQLDMHDDDTKNRVFVDPERNLIIREISEEDGAYYFCYDVENSMSSMKMDILLDIGLRSTLEPTVIDLPANLDKEVPKILKPCEKLKGIPPLAMYSCYSEWGIWSQCDVCGKVGKRKRVGECRLQKFQKAKIEAPGGQMTEADFPIVGIGCRSVLLNVIPAAQKLLNQIPNIVLQENCEVSCEKQTITAVVKEEQEGTSLTFFCPGASLDTRVKWKYQNRALNPQKVKDSTGGRLLIDATDALHIKNLRVSDGGEYVCMLYEVEIGLVRLKVTSKYTVFDPTSNFGILTIAMILSFILWIALMVVKWKTFMLQRKIQEKRAHRKAEYEAVDIEETEPAQV